MRNRRLPIAFVLTLLTASLVGLTVPAFAHGGAHGLTILAQEQDCPGDRAFCFEVTEGSLADVGPGDEVTMTLENEGSSLHNLYVTGRQQADPGGDTPAEAAFATSEDLDRGEEDTITFTVPDDVETLYLWCEISGHEQLGMYTVQSSSGAGTADAGSANESPAPGVVAVLVLGLVAGTVALGARRRA